MINDNEERLEIMVETVIPELFKYVDKYKHLFEEEDFLHSQIADGINSILNEVILFSGSVAIKTGREEDINKIENEYSLFFTQDAIKRYPTLNGLFTTFKITNIAPFISNNKCSLKLPCIRCVYSKIC